MADLTAQVAIEADASGVEAGVGRAKRSISELGQAGAQAGQKAGQGLQAIGKGSSEAARDLDRNTTAMVRSIQRQIAAAEAGGRGTAAYYREIANQRGLKLDVLEPYLRQLDEVSAKQSKGGAEMAAFEARARSLGMSVGELRAATRGLPAQFTDIIVSLQAGQQPMTVLLQQGGQLKDMFGGLGPAVRAMGGYVMGLINPLTVAAAAATALGAAYYQGWQQSREMERTLIASGNAAGVSAGQLQALTDRLGAATGRYGDARAAALALATSGVSGSAALGEAMQGVLDGLEVTGKSVEDLADEFADLAKDPVTAILKLNESQNFLTAAIFETIKALQEQGRETEAAALAQRTYAQTLAERKDEIVRNVGFVESAWIAVKRATREAIEAALDVGRPDTLQRQLEAAQARLRQFQDDGFKRGSALRERQVKEARAVVDDLQERIRLEGQLTSQRAERARVEQAGVAAIEKVSGIIEQGRSRTERMNAELAEFRGLLEDIRRANPESQLLDPAKIAAAEKVIRDKYTEKGGGGNSESQAASIRGRIEAEKMLAAALNERYAALLAGGTANAKVLPAEQQLLQVTERLRVATTAKAKADLQSQKAELERLVPLEKANEAIREQIRVQEEFERSRERERDAQLRDIDTITQKTIALEAEIATYGQGRAAIEETTAARLREKLAILETFEGSEGQRQLIEREIAARERLAAAMAQKDVRDANAKAAQEAARDWERVTDQVGQALTDSLFEGGRSAKEQLERLFRTMILRPLLQPIIQGGMNAIGSSLGIPGAPGVATGSSFNFGSLLGGGNISGSVSNFVDVAGIKLYQAGLEDVGNALVENSAAIGKFANTAGQVFGYGKAIYDITQGAYGSAIGTAVGTYILPGIGTAVGSMLGGLVDGLFSSGETRYGGGYTVGADGRYIRSGGPSGGDPAEAQTIASLERVRASVDQLAARLGGSASNVHIGAGWELSPDKGNSFVWADVVRGADELSWERGLRSLEGVTDMETVANEFGLELNRVVVRALQMADLPRAFADIVNAVDVGSLDADGVQQVLAALDALQRFTAALGELPFTPAAAATADFAKALADAAGGAEAASSQLASYYQNYYREAERAEHLTRQLTERFAALGLELPRTRDEFRAIVEANLALGEAGARTVAELLSMESALSSILPAFEAITDAAAEANAAFEAQLGVVRQLADEAARLDTLRMRAGSVADQIAKALGRAGQYGALREAELWAAMTGAAYEQQIELASELADIVLERYNAEIAAAERMFDLERSLAGYIDSLRVGDLSPLTLGERTAEAERQLMETIARANAGDVDAMSQVQGQLEAALRLWREYGASGAAYQAAYERLTGAAADVAARAQSDAERQLAVSADTLAQLEQLHGVAESAYAALDRQYQAAQAAAQAEMGKLTDIGANTGRLHDIAGLLQGMPASIAAALQPMLSAAAASTVGGWYQEAGYGHGDAAGRAHWTEQLQLRPQDEVRHDFLHGIITGWYREMLGREPDSQGMQHWLDVAKRYGLEAALEAFKGSARTVGELLPGYANGGLTGTGLAWVGERGPEIVDFRTPARVYSTAELGAALRMPTGTDGPAALIAEIRALRQEVAQLRAERSQDAQRQIQTTEQTGERTVLAMADVADAITARERDDANRFGAQRVGNLTR